MRYVLLFCIGCSTASATDAPRQGDNGAATVGSAVPVIVESDRNGAPCVEWTGDPSAPVAVADVGCCPVGYGIVGLTHGTTGEDAIVCLVLP